MGVDRSRWPVMVRVGLWAIPTRALAWVYFWLALAIATACIIYGRFYPIVYTGVLMVFAALWYYLSIRWVDRHSTWS